MECADVPNEAAAVLGGVRHTGRVSIAAAAIAAPSPPPTSAPRSDDALPRWGYKVFPCPTLQVLGFQYSLVEPNVHDGPVVPNRSGLHYCAHPPHCHRWYPPPKKLTEPSPQLYAMVHAVGDVVLADGDSLATDGLAIVRLIPHDEWWRLCTGRFLRADGTAEWFRGARLHRGDGGPAVDRPVPRMRAWMRDGVPHRDDGGPAVEMDNDGLQLWMLNGRLHREDGPAVVRRDGSQCWYLHGELHRDDGGPAVVDADGTRMWRVRGQLHREDGPAVEQPDGSVAWYRRGEIHRDDGPAMVSVPDRLALFYRHGSLISYVPLSLSLFRSLPVSYLSPTSPESGTSPLASPYPIPVPAATSVPLPTAVPAPLPVPLPAPAPRPVAIPRASVDETEPTIAAPAETQTPPETQSARRRRRRRRAHQRRVRRTASPTTPQTNVIVSGGDLLPAPSASGVLAVGTT